MYAWNDTELLSHTTEIMKFYNWAYSESNLQSQI